MTTRTLPQNLTGTAAILIQFDDGHGSIYDIAYDYMEPRNIPGSFFVATSLVGGANMITAEELLHLHASGWTIANHTRDHTDLTTIPLAQIETELTNGKADLQGYGITGNGPFHVAYPYGSWNATVLTAMANTDMLTGRRVSQIACQTLPYTDPYKIQIGLGVVLATPLNTVKAWVDSVVSNECVGIVLFHYLSENPVGTYEWGADDFRAFIDFLVDLEVPCITTDEAYNAQFGSITARVPQRLRRAATRLHLIAAQEED